ncbi:MAG: hypothetical protein ACOYJU_02430 [Anaerovoracaceae bacterium]|jgi:hypothetical protein
MLEFLQYQWVVGSGTGIISGIIVYLITKYIFQRKDKSKYLEQINMANIEIIRTLKPYVAEKGLPEKEIIDAIIISTARKYKVNSDELFSIRIICEELIREIVENVYVSSDRKQDYSKQLTEYLHDLDVQQVKALLTTDIEKEYENIKNAERIDYKKRLTTVLSLMLSLVASLLSLVIVLMDDAFLMLSDITFEPILIIFVVSISSIAILFITLSTQRLFEKSKNRDKKDKRGND